MQLRSYYEAMDTTLDKRSPQAKDESPRALSLKFKDRSVYITKRFSIGRHASNDIPLPHDPLVSRRHARIEFVKGIYYIHDLHSTNGTYLNNMPLQKGEKAVLTVGDTITIGKTKISVSNEIKDYQ